MTYRDRAKLARYGDRTSCRLCGSDIEFLGKPRKHESLALTVGGWTDRGGNRFCDTSGAARWDEDGVLVPFPHVLHKPTSDVVS